PVDSVTKYGPVKGDSIVEKEEIPFEKERKFNPDLAPGTEKVTREGQKGGLLYTSDADNEQVNVALSSPSNA
ncbi:G5 domain-containing protein, partial [Staphylococcus aureus]|uniref:G5 domain-containing protein n=1 Tax=Staphylococcus aureus TaxID=1280 RepID=UPI001FB036AB